MKYIDADRLKAEIERLYDIARDASYNGEIEGEMTAYDKILSIITSLQQEQPEVDLEKEAKECWDYVFASGWDDNSFMTMNHKEFSAFARHFYELGFNARKEE